MLVIARGEVRWADFGSPSGSEPGYRRPVVVVSADAFNASRISTVTVVAVSSNTSLSDAPGNISLPAEAVGLWKDSVINVSQIATLDKHALSEPVGHLAIDQLDRLDIGSASSSNSDAHPLRS